MSAAEIGHRLVELARKQTDKRREFSWDQFGRFDGPLLGLSGLARLLLDLPNECHSAGTEAFAGRFHLLNTEWPCPGCDWKKTIWHLDPVSETFWAGKESFCFDVPYRHAADKGDVKFVWEINRLQFLQHIARDAVRHNRARNWVFIRDVLRNWMHANPPFRGINWTNGIEAASRLLSVAVILSFADEKQRQALEPIVKPFIEAHLFWLLRYPSLYSSANNHRVAELAAIFLAARCVPEMLNALRYEAEAREALELEILRQFHADGVGAEQSPTYAAYSLEWFVLAGLVAERRDMAFSAAYRARAKAALVHLCWLLDDGHDAPKIGDNDEGRVLAFHSASYVASVCALTTRWLNLAPPEPLGRQTFAEGGYTVERYPTEQGTLLTIFDHGPLGFLSIAAHGHADALSFWLHWGEEPILIDAGTYLYHSGGVTRDMLRGTPAHNTISVESANQSTIAGPFNWSRYARARLVARDENSVTAECDGYASAFGVLHRRCVGRVKDRVIRIEDTLKGRPKRSSLRWTSAFLIAPEIELKLSGETVHLKTPQGRHLSMRLIGPPGISWRSSHSICSPAFNRSVETLRIEACGTLAAQSDFKLTTEIRLGA